MMRLLFIWLSLKWYRLNFAAVVKVFFGCWLEIWFSVRFTPHLLSHPPISKLSFSVFLSLTLSHFHSRSLPSFLSLYLSVYQNPNLLDSLSSPCAFSLPSLSCGLDTICDILLNFTLSQILLLHSLILPFFLIFLKKEHFIIIVFFRKFESRFREICSDVLLRKITLSNFFAACDGESKKFGSNLRTS